MLGPVSNYTTNYIFLVASNDYILFVTFIFDTLSLASIFPKGKCNKPEIKYIVLMVEIGIAKEMVTDFME